MATFCKSCGLNLPKIEKAPEPKDVEIIHKTSSTNFNSDNPLAENLFISPTENIMASIGNSYLQNFLVSNNFKQNIAIVTEKRMYYKGTAVADNGIVTNEEGCVSLEDITFTKFTTNTNGSLFAVGICFAVVGLIIAFTPLSILGIIGIVIGIALAIIGTISQNTVFLVSFAGGQFTFDVSSYPMSEFRNFQRELHLLKDKLKEK